MYQFFYSEIDNCVSNPCLNSGKCVNAKDGYKCECKDGFTGENCDEEIDECDSNPCYSNAKCLDQVRSRSSQEVKSVCVKQK